MNFLSHCQFKEYVGGYLAEARWANEGYTPTLKEYLRISNISSGYPFLMCATSIIYGVDLTTDALEWALKVPDIIEVSANITRLMNDVASYKVHDVNRPN